MKQARKKNTRTAEGAMKKRKGSAAVFTKKRVIIGAVALVLVLAAFFGVLVAVNAYRNSGKGIRDVVILKSEHFELTVPMFSYYVRLMGVDKTQYMGMAEVLMERMMIYEAAVADGVTLSEEENAQLEQKMTLLAYDAEKEKMGMDEYLSVTYGRGVKLADIRRFEQMLALSRVKGETILKDIAATEEELVQYCKENGDDFLFCDFLFPLIEVPFTEGMTTAEKEALVEEYEGYANEMAESESAEQLLERYAECLGKIQKARGEEELTEQDLAGILARADYTRQSYKDSLSSELAIDAWLFSTDRKVGDGKVQKGGSIDKAMTFGVFYMTRPLYTNTDLTDTVYDIVVPFSVYTTAAAEANIKKVEQLYKSAPDEQTLKDLALQYSGGLSENYICSSSTDDTLLLWLKQERKVGDTMTYKAEDGWHFVCYQEKGLPECYAQAKQLLDGKELDARMEAYAKEHRVSMDTAGFQKIPALRYGWLIFG
ncbi:MAG: hypothetical protein E7599_03775 [Ruminococcaceae bacterium]|nr:hypothetical protein [Oscillospiraceae bacterium]